MHYQRYRKGRRLDTSTKEKRPAIIEGDIAKIPLGVDAVDGYAIVDKHMSYLDTYKWSRTHYGYAQARVSGSIVKMHHLVIARRGNLTVDHINRNKLDNRTCNLRLVTLQQNAANRGSYGKLIPGVKGIYKNKNRYTARIKKHGKRIHGGTHDTIEEAALAYNQLAAEHFGEYAALNEL